MPQNKNFSTTLRLFLLYLFPVALYCSYFPRLLLASSQTTNYELSLPLILLFLFSVLSLKDFWHYIYNIYINIKTKTRRLTFTDILPASALLFPFYLFLSALWSPNPLRAVLTAGVFACLYISIVSIFASLKNSRRFQKSVLEKSFLLSAVFFSVICWLQCFLDVAGVPRTVTLLCRGCVSESFGFPHPSGFTIEPQFMGNLLLAPTLYVLYEIARTKPEQNPQQTKILFLLGFFFLSTLFLTFSRGAIYSFGVAFVVLVLFEVIKNKNRAFLLVVPLAIISFLFTLCAQGFMAELSPTSDTFSSGVSKSLSQLSLGLIELDSAQDATNDNSLEAQDHLDPDGSRPPSNFSGYVEESTNIRLDLNRFALESSVASPTSFIFGYGLGSAGRVLYDQGKSSSTMEIVQNEPLSLLLETGLLGLLLLALLFVYIFYLLFRTTKNAISPRTFLLVLILAYALSLNFFSGLPNALHIYLFPAFILLFTKHKSVIN